MSDQWGPEAGDEMPATPPPPPPPPVESILTLDDQTEIRRSGGIGGRAVAAVVGVLLLVGGTLFAVTQSGGSGPGSAEAAVAELLEAASDEDVLGLMAAIDPSEREVLRQPIIDLFDELGRLEVVDDSFELTGIAGVDLEFEGVTYRTEPIRDGLARVYLTGGTVTGSFDGGELPIGDFVQDTLDRFGGDISDVRESETTDIVDGEEAFLVARETGDGWRVSIGYSIAEIARLDAGLPFPTLPGVDPIGADSPEAAVEGMLRAAVTLDFREMIARLSPAEFAALQEYSMLFLPDLEREVSRIDDEFGLTVDDLELRSETSGDRALVFVDSFQAYFDYEDVSLTFGYADGCFTLEGDPGQLEDFGFDFDEVDGPICADDVTESYEESLQQFEDEAGIDLPAFPELAAPNVGITTMKVDGDWYVAPVATGLDATVAFLEVLDRETLDTIVDFIEEAITAFGTAFEETFTETGNTIGGFDDDFGSSDLDDDGSWDDLDFNALTEWVIETYAYEPDKQDCAISLLLDADPTIAAQVIARWPGADIDPAPTALRDEVFRSCGAPT